MKPELRQNEASCTGNVYFDSRALQHRKALAIAGSAIETSKRTRRLLFCRALLTQLNPDEPPPSSHAREFNWQYRALRERVHLYSEKLRAAQDPDKSTDYGITKTEWAVELSLRYFQDVLSFSNRIGCGNDVEQEPEF